MKQKFFLSFIAIAVSVLSVSAQDDGRLVVNVGNIDNINIADGLDIILAPGNLPSKSVSLNAAASEILNMQLSDNSLSISSLKHTARKERITVYVYVNKLKTITVENNSRVKTIGLLDAPKLDVFIDGDATVHLKTNGEVNAHSLNDAEMQIKYLSAIPLVKR